MVIQSLVKQSYDFGIIAGDNIYPYKKEKNKIYYSETLTRGYNYLQRNLQNNKTKHVILGNHNVAANSIKEMEINIYKTPFMLYTEIATCCTICFKNFIFLNTNLITPEHMNDVITTLNSQLSSLTNDLPIFIVGHEPLVAAKKKDGNSFVYLHGFTNIVALLFEYIKKGKNIAYLCADVHNFQAISVSCGQSILPIIVSGTGGADPDLDIFNESDMSSHVKAGMEIYNIEVKIKEKPYGYCIIDNSTNVTYHTFQEHLGPTKTLKPEIDIGFLKVKTALLENPSSIEKPPYTYCNFLQTPLYTKSKGGKR